MQEANKIFFRVGTSGAAIVLAALLGACQSHHNDSPTPPSSPPPQQQQHPSDQTQNNKPPDSSSSTPPETVAPPPVQQQDSTQQQDQKYEAERRQIAANAGKQIAQALNSAKTTLGNFGDTLLATGKALIFIPTDEKQRQHVLNNIDDQAKGEHQTDFRQLRANLAATEALPLEKVSQTIKFDDEPSSLFANYISESDPSQLDNDAQALIDEIFVEPDQATAKSQEVQLDVRRLADANLYGTAQAQRMAYADALVDKKLDHDEYAQSVRRNTFFVASSLVLGGVAGLHGFEKAKEFIDDASLAKLRAGRDLAWNGTKRRFSNYFGRTGTWVHKLLPTRLTNTELAMRDLRSLGLNRDEVEALQLTEVPRAYVDVRDLQGTNLPAFKYAVVDQFGGKDLEPNRMLVMTTLRLPQLNLRSVYVGSKVLPKEVADELAQRLAYRSPSEGGKDFLVGIDEQTGEITPTRIDAAQVDESLNEPVNNLNEVNKPGEVAPPPLPPVENIESVDHGITEVSGEEPYPAVHAENGEATLADLSASAEQPLAPSAKSVAEANADGDTHIRPVVTTGAEHESLGQRAVHIASDAVGAAKGLASSAAESAASSTGKIIDKTKGALEAAADKASAGTAKVRGVVQPVLSRFDPRWAGVVTGGTLASEYVLYFRGYQKGKTYGQGRNSLYLERLVPRDQMQNIVLRLPSDESP